jgi:hypothetical protein
MDAFIRFVSRRGKPAVIISDAHKTYIRADEELKVLTDAAAAESRRFPSPDIVNKVSEMGIQWQTLPPKASHFAGLHEAKVKLLKSAILKTLGKACLTDWQFYSVACHAEMVCNSVPLAAVTEDINDCRVITPALLATGRELTSLPYAPKGMAALRDLPAGKRAVLMSWRHRQSMNEQFEARYVKDYLARLSQATQQYFHRPDPVKEGQLVLVHKENTKRQNFPLARIVSVTRNRDDGRIRTVRLRGANGKEFSRALTCVIPLQLQLEEDISADSSATDDGASSSSPPPAT